MRTLTKGDLAHIDPEILAEIRSLRLRYISVGSQRFCRSVFIAPDGQWYAWIENSQRKILRLKGFRLRRQGKAWRDEQAARRRSAVEKIRLAHPARRPLSPSEVLRPQILRVEQNLRRIESKIHYYTTLRRKRNRRLLTLQRRLTKLSAPE